MEQKDLQKFCADNIPRMSHPFSIGEHTYAANGHILVRIPRMSAVPEYQDAPKISDVEKHFNSHKKCIPLPDDIPPTQHEKCIKCDGAGKMAKCPECDGSGVIYFSNKYNDYDCSCETCEGEGVVIGNDSICKKCGGKGKIEKFTTVKVAGRYYQNKYLLLMKTLPGCKLELIEKQHEYSPAYFIFEGGDGLLMPVRQ